MRFRNRVAKMKDSITATGELLLFLQEKDATFGEC